VLVLLGSDGGFADSYLDLMWPEFPRRFPTVLTVIQTLVRDTRSLAHFQKRVAMNDDLIDCLLLKLVRKTKSPAHNSSRITFYDFYQRKCRVNSGCIYSWQDIDCVDVNDTRTGTSIIGSNSHNY
jgi:hypothetical protein